MPEIKRLSIDIGTNSVLGLLAAVKARRMRVIFDVKITTRLGEGLNDTGILQPQAIDRTVDAVHGLLLKEGFDEVIILGTEALRISRNSREFREKLLNLTGYDVRIISGQKEAELAFLGALYNLPLSGESIVLIDVGGGSTEIVIAESGQIAASFSIPMGALRLREKVGSRYFEDYFQFVRPIFAEALGNFKAAPDSHLVATGGTITSAAAIVFGGKEYKSSVVHGRELDTDRMLVLAHKFEKAAPENQKELIPFDPERADLILPGLGIFLAVLGIFRKDRVIVSAGGLRFGAALYPEKIRA